MTTRKPRLADVPKVVDPLVYDTDFEVSLSLCCGHKDCAEKVTVEIDDGDVEWAKKCARQDAREAGWHVEDVAFCPVHRKQLPLFA